MEKKKHLSVYEKICVQRINQLISDYCEGSQQRFVERTGLNKGSVSQYVNGKNTPSNINASKIATAFNVDPAWVMGFDIMPPGIEIETVSSPCPDLTLHEKELINAYRNASDDIQIAVCAVLGIKRDTKSKAETSSAG